MDTSVITEITRISNHSLALTTKLCYGCGGISSVLEEWKKLLEFFEKELRASALNSRFSSS